MPVKTIARPASSAAAITSSSRIEPPGWITAVAPASTAASRPSAKGKKASEATAEPIVRGSRPAGFLGRVLRLPGGDAGGFEPVHLAGADPGGGAVLGIDDGVRLDVLGDRPGEQAVGQLALGRRALGHHLEVVARRSGRCRAIWTSQPPAIDFSVRPGRAGSGSSPVSSRRRFFFAAKTAARLLVGVGRDHHLGEDRGDRLGGRRASSGRLTATMPPKAETLSQAKAAS